MQPIIPLLFLASTPTSQAESPGLRYSYVDISFAVVRPDEDSADLGGGIFAEFDDARAISLGASFSLNERFFLQGGLGTSSQDIVLTDGVDVANGEYEARTLTLGVGARHPLGATVDVYAVAGLASVSANLDFPGIGSESDSETGLALELGLRALVASQVEVQASFARIDLDEATNTFGAALRFHATDTLSFALSAQDTEDASAFGVGVRFGF